jgi:hypothetical protein
MHHQRRQGDIIPGFDCRTGKAVGFIRGEWDKLLEGLTMSRVTLTSLDRRDCYLIAMDADGLPLYEIFTHDEIRNPQFK